MISEIHIEGFKSLKDVTLKLGRLNLFLGTNASGKSNFLDALRVLQGIGYGFTVDEIFNGKPRSATSEVWEGIRGGSAMAAFGPRDALSQPVSTVKFDLTLELEPLRTRRLSYAIDLVPDLGAVRGERLAVGSEPVFEANWSLNLCYLPNGGDQPYKLDDRRPALHQLLGDARCLPEHQWIIGECIHDLSDMQRFEPLPFVLRGYSQPRSVRRMGERGEDFAALVKTVTFDADTRAAYLSWLQQLTPAEVDDVAILPGALGEPLFALVEKGVRYPAPVLSDGTLRFAAIAAALFQPDMPGIITLEEIENGIHPTRLRLLLELLKTQAVSPVQIFATTHSPVVLSWLDEKDYETTFLCKRDEETGASQIVPLSQVPRFLEVAGKHPVDDLLVEGWLEGAL